MEPSEEEIQVFTDAISHYFFQTSGEPVMVDAPFIQNQERVSLEYTGIINVTGKARGSVYFTTDAPLLKTLLDAIGHEGERNDNAMRDLVGEAANTMTGNMRQHFGRNFIISAPKVLQQEKVQLPRSAKVLVLPVIWQGFLSYLVVCLGRGSSLRGSFADMPFTEILSMAARHSGRLQIRNHDSGHKFELHIHEGMLRSFLIDGIPLLDVLTLRVWVTKLIGSEVGEFEFIRDWVEDEGPHLIPLKQLIVNGISADETLDVPTENLPSPHTIFVLAEQQDIFLGADLSAFLELASPALIKGISANDLATLIHMPVDHIILKFHQLKTVGIITAARALPVGRNLARHQPASPRPSHAVIPSFTANAPRSLIGKILSGLRHRLQS